MSLQQLKAEATALSTQDRKELIGFLVGLGRERSPEYWDRMAAKIENRDAGCWVAEDGLDRALGLDKSE